MFYEWVLLFCSPQFSHHSSGKMDRIITFFFFGEMVGCNKLLSICRRENAKRKHSSVRYCYCFLFVACLNSYARIEDASDLRTVALLFVFLHSTQNIRKQHIPLVWCDVQDMLVSVTSIIIVLSVL